MEALTELCDLIAKNPSAPAFADKVSWICSRCPSASSLSSPHRLTRTHLNSILVLARFLSLTSAPPAPSRSPVLDFLRSSPLPPSLWPLPFSLDSISSFYSSFFSYLSSAADLAADLQPLIGPLLLSAACNLSSSPDASTAAISKAFLVAAVKNCPVMLSMDVEKLVDCLLEGVGEGGTLSENSNSSSMSWDSKGKGKEEEIMDDGSSENVRENGNGTVVRMENGSSSSSSNVMATPTIEEESVEVLEKMEIAFRLVGVVIDREGKNVKLGNLERVRKVATSQLKSVPAFLKVSV